MEEVANISSRSFPIFGPPWKRRTIPWFVAEKAYKEYSRQFGTDQSLERIAERGGFSEKELDRFYPEWRSECP